MAGDRPLWWRNTLTKPAVGAAAQLIVVTDIDGSLLGPRTHIQPRERAALDFLALRGIPLVINSSRTRAEIERIHDTLRLLTPFISEHGSALFIPNSCFPSIPSRAATAVSGHVIEFGRPYHQVVDAVRVAGCEAGVEIVGFADLTIEDAAREFGVTTMEGQLAKLREYTEVIRIIDETEATRSRVFNALRRKGLRCWPVGRHHLVTAARNRADSLLTLRALWRHAWGEPHILGFADSEDAIAWLRYTDVGVLVQNDGTRLPPRIASRLPTAYVTKESRRLGWSDAIFECVGTLLNRGDQPEPGIGP